MKKQLLALCLCLTLLGTSLPALAAGGYTEDAALYTAPHTSTKINLSHALVKGLGVMSGGEGGSMNWDRTLTRVEAATMLVRLMGAEAEAQALQSTPTPFTDVPAWANGYVNYAYEHKVVQGVGAELFGPDRLCSAQEFLTMLFRLTDLEEGTDYAWATAVEDALAAMEEVSDISSTIPYNPPYAKVLLPIRYGSAVRREPFTRELAAGSIFRMMNIVAGPRSMSLADKLADEYGLSSTVFYDCGVRRTFLQPEAEPTYTLHDLGPLESVSLAIRKGALCLDAPTGVELAVFQGDDYESSPLSTGRSVALPKAACTLRLEYEKDYTYYHTYVKTDYQDGQHGFVLGKENGDSSASVDPALYHVVAEDGFHLRAKKADVYATANADRITEEVRALSAQLTAGKTTEYAKGKAISTWVAEHIFYDYDGSTPVGQNILETRRGVCGDYAYLTWQLLYAAGLECYVESSDSHDWNVAYLDGKWVMLDTTWDSNLKYWQGEYLAHDSSRPKRDVSLSDVAYSYPVSNREEPGVAGRQKYFDMDPLRFYLDGADHLPQRTPALYIGMEDT